MWNEIGVWIQQEKERSPEGLEEVEKKLSSFEKTSSRAEKKQEKNLCSSCRPAMIGTTASINGELISCSFPYFTGDRVLYKYL